MGHEELGYLLCGITPKVLLDQGQRHVNGGSAASAVVTWPSFTTVSRESTVMSGKRRASSSDMAQSVVILRPSRTPASVIRKAPVPTDTIG